MVDMPFWPIFDFNTKRAIKYDLSRITQLMTLLDHPHSKLSNVIHVAGTNGKGSTIAFLKSIFQTAGYSVNTYTSPHLIEFNERINIKGKPISDEYLLEMCKYVKGVVEKSDIQPTFFENITAIAFCAFAENNADVTLIETGMGGRLDSTNVFETPLCSIITPISYDHTEYLGDTLEMIALEKAGIIKNNSWVFLSKQNDKVTSVINKVCMALNSKMVKCHQSIYYDILNDLGKYEANYCNLQGDHQLVNASTAITVMSSRLVQSHFNITKLNIYQGIKNANWMGRIQKINENDVVRLIKSTSESVETENNNNIETKNVLFNVSNNIQKDNIIDLDNYKNYGELWVDCAHNNDGAKVLNLWLKDYINNLNTTEKLSSNTTNKPKKTVGLILGMLSKRDPREFISYFDCIDFIYCVKINTEFANYTAEDLSKILQNTIAESSKNNEKMNAVSESHQKIKVYQSNLKAAITDSVLKNDLSVVAGSIFLVSDVLKLFGNKQ